MTISVGQVTSWATQAINIALLVLVAVAILAIAGVRVPYVRSISHLELLYLCAAWAFVTGRIKLG